jgi:hypothetical protein
MGAEMTNLKKATVSTTSIVTTAIHLRHNRKTISKLWIRVEGATITGH